MTPTMIETQGLSKAYGRRHALRNIDLQVRRGEWVALVGPSGCGKSTLLGLLGGHETPTSGSVTIAGKARTLFQHDALFPWLTVEANIALGLRHMTSASQKHARVSELLALTGLEASRSAYPHELSGGMKQRAQFAWALAADADVLLLDEPFSALDFLNRHTLREELVRLLEGREMTLVLVTHDLTEAALLADRVLVLSPGPGRLVKEVTLTSPRPRHLGDADVVATTTALMAVLQSTLAEAEADASP